MQELAPLLSRPSGGFTRGLSQAIGVREFQPLFQQPAADDVLLEVEADVASNDDDGSTAAGDAGALAACVANVQASTRRLAGQQVGEGGVMVGRRLDWLTGSASDSLNLASGGGVRVSGRANTPSWVLRDTAWLVLGSHQRSQGSSTHSLRERVKPLARRRN